MDKCKICGQGEDASMHKASRYHQVPGGYGHPFEKDENAKFEFVEICGRNKVCQPETAGGCGKLIMMMALILKWKWMTLVP